jgi:hypothetical protein
VKLAWDPSITLSMPPADLRRIPVPPGGQLPPLVEIVRPFAHAQHGFGVRGEAPAFVDGHDRPFAVQNRHADRQRGEDRGLHLFAAAQRVFGGLAGQRARQHVGHEIEPARQLVALVGFDGAAPHGDERAEHVAGADQRDGEHPADIRDLDPGMGHPEDRRALSLGLDGEDAFRDPRDDGRDA